MIGSGHLVRGRPYRCASVPRTHPGARRPGGEPMLDLDERLDELRELGRYRRLRMVSGPQGPRVVLDGRPVLLLCSGNALGLADHPAVRAAAADAAMRWGVGAGAPLEELAELARRHDVRLLVDESHAIGSLGPDGRGAVAEAGLEDEVDVITGSLGLALRAYGGLPTPRPTTAPHP